MTNNESQSNSTTSYVNIENAEEIFNSTKYLTRFNLNNKKGCSNGEEGKIMKRT